MRLLLDSHALIWWFAGDPQLSVPARRAVEDEENNVLVSAASAWEIATKHRIGKLPEALVLSQPRNRKGLEAKGRTDGLGPSLRKSVWVIVIWRLTEY